MTTAETASARFWNRSARRYANRKITDPRAYEKTLERTRAWLEPHHRALEIGCGTGSIALLLAPHVQHLTGSDIAGEMIAIAEQKRAADDPGNLTFVTATPFDTRFESSSFDAVLAFNVLHLMQDLPATLGRIRDLLGPGGLLISKTPCLGDMGVTLRLVVPLLQKLGMAPPVSFISRNELRAATDRAGFDILESGLHAAKGPSLFIVARRP